MESIENQKIEHLIGRIGEITRQYESAIADLTINANERLRAYEKEINTLRANQVQQPAVEPIV
jgi:hypothetical protein